MRKDKKYLIFINLALLLIYMADISQINYES
jgi:hypothetical protein